MKKRLLKTITVLCLLCVFFVPVRVSAAGNNSTYLAMTANECYLNVIKRTNDYYYAVAVNNDSRVVILGTTAYIVNNNVNGFSIKSNSASFQLSACAGYFNSVSYNTTVNNVRYWYETIPNVDTSYNPYNIPVINDTVNVNKAVYYTFGDGAVDPTPPGPDYGNLIDLRFNTDIAGSGSAAVNNIDHIKWNPDIDSNGISFDGSERVEIQAIPGNYTASSRNSLLTLGVSDFDYNSGTEHLLAELPVKNGEYTVSWSHVIQQLNSGSVSDFLGIRKSSDTWLKSGWIYQIRLVAGEYTSEWQTIYNATSSGVENSLTVENSTEINMELINVIQSINTMNSSQYENWTINNITINMENSDGQQTTDKPWWAYLLEAIVKAFGDILTFLGNLIGDLMEAITDLFKPAEFTINEYNDFKVEIKQNSGIFGQAIDFTNNLKNTFMGVQYQEPILHWQGISFGETVFIPAADYNLNDYVTMWGLGDFRQLAYLCSDGFIFFSLLLLIIRKLNEVLKK